MNAPAAGAWPDELHTACGLLRRLQPGDAQALFEGITGDREVTRYLGWRTHETLDQTRNLVSYELARWQRDVARTWVLDLPERRVCGMFQVIGQGPTRQIGFALARRFWGRGLATDAVATLVAVAFTHPSVYRVEAVCDAENDRSSRLLQQAGMKLEARLGRYILHPNLSPQPRDALMHAKVRREE
ncbi:GNAT family N-acetyltransferase [Methyloversatilis thermotolerans]|uniref:GNAT family N-acetyltransferase n=1 Tax=Methyloversatilis thermotolerans TaxID=1346290 RepID=UPI00037F0141|nr:GNAT family N-acetyltransferase [Methyloversatilis thermotolerans]